VLIQVLAGHGVCSAAITYLAAGTDPGNNLSLRLSKVEMRWSLLLLAACCLALAHDEGAAGCAFVVATPAAPDPLRLQGRSARLLLATRRRPSASGAGDGGARKGGREFVTSPSTGAALPLHLAAALGTRSHCRCSNVRFAPM